MPEASISGDSAVRPSAGTTRRFRDTRAMVLGGSADDDPGRYAAGMPTGRPIHDAEVLSIGSELTVGETRDTNAGRPARSLAERGISVGRIQALPDRLDVVADAVRSAIGRAGLVVSTGGLGPT